MNIEWFITGILSVVCFFYFSNTLPRKWANYSVKKMGKKLFWNTLILRIIWILCFYAYTMLVWNTPWEQPLGNSIDSSGYFGEGVWVTEMIKTGELQNYFIYIQNQGSLADIGYPLYLGIMNLFGSGSILFSRLFNALFDAWSVVLLYRLATRNFGENIGRLAGIMMMIMPLMFFYSGLTMKESIMVMCCLWFLERSDLMIRERKFSFLKIATVILLVGSIFFFRAALAIVAIMSIFSAIVFTSGTVIGWQKRIMMGLFIFSIIGVFASGYIMTQVEEIEQQRQTAGNVNLEFRATRKGGNALAGKLTEGLFAPFIFTIPFPTMVDIPGQPTQQLLNGANYIKNVMSFFCVLSLFLLLKHKQWRKHALPLAFMCGYMVTLGLSSYAHAGRFHQPAVPLELMFAAFAICNINKKQSQWFNYFLVFEFTIVVIWTWFKLAGRGLA